ncbi:MAG: acylphosphatase [Methylococcaceae bacterium]|nr:acylphosphatase [Methylococcaceae bacterium]
MRKVQIFVSGRVQGVYFRVFTRNKAKQLGINGYAKNLADGRVEIVAHAPAANVQQLIDWCHKGPITARVDHVEWIELEVDEQMATFEIR